MTLVTIPRSLKHFLIKPYRKYLAWGTVHLKKISLMFIITLKNYSSGFCRLICFSLDQSFGIINNQVVLFWCCIVFRGLRYSDTAQYFIPQFVNPPPVRH